MAIWSDMKRRTLAERVGRIVLALIVAVLGYCGVIFSIGQAVVNNDPAMAYRLVPYDGRITAAYASSLSGADATMQDRLRADELAKRALRQDRTAVSAAATLGVNADIRGDRVAARRYFTYAQALSRRDLRTQLWMIEDAVARGDVPATLRQYDISLRVFPYLEKMLYPVLVSAVGDSTIRKALARTLAGKPSWGESFINFVAVDNPKPQSTAELFVDLRRLGGVIPQSAQASVINALINKGAVGAAWSYYLMSEGSINRYRSRDPRFTADKEPPSFFDWLPLGTGGLSTVIQDDIFDFSAPASVGGPMLQQLQLLPAGRYRLSGHSIGIDQERSGNPYWTLKCQDGRELGRIEVPNSTYAQGVFAGTFMVPANCSAQSLLLTARPSDKTSGLSGQLDFVELVPLP